MTTEQSEKAADARDVTGRWLDAVSQGSNEVVALVGASGQVLHAGDNGVVERLTGYALGDLPQLSLRQIIHADDLDAVKTAFSTLLQKPSGRHSLTVRLLHRHGTVTRVMATGVNHLHDGVVGAIVVRLRASAEGNAPSIYPEPVENLKDRDQLMVAIDHAIESRARDPKQGFRLLLIEFDSLNMLIGNYGQRVVDLLVIEIAKRLTGLLRPGDSLAQVASGEFAVLMQGNPTQGEEGVFMGRVQKVVGERYRISGQQITVSSSIGMATSERAYEDGEQALSDAALAVSRARRRQRRRHVVFQTQMRVEDKRYMSLVDQLHSALGQNQFCLHYQPIISLEGRQLRGFEALVRWDHPSEGLISPGEFIPVAEETGLIVTLGKLVLENACAQMAEWNRRYAGNDPLYVSVNLSPVQFADEDLFGHIEHALEHSKLDAHQLNLEITETAVLENQAAATDVLNKFKARGVKVSLDDFGTGYSSFSHLHQLPYDTLKIDRSFVSRIGGRGENVEVIHAIVMLAHNLGLRVVAEGVETESQANQLQRVGCESAQGYYFARPLDVRAAEKLLSG